MEKEDLLKLIEDDDLGLLVVKPRASAVTADERLVASFQEINDFVRKHGRPPELNPKDIQEFTLYSRLKGLKQSPEKIEALSALDEFNILEPAKPIESVKDIFEDDDLGLLNDDAESIFELKHVPKIVDMPDSIAKRKPCKDFKEFEPLFKECQRKLSTGERKLVKFEDEYSIQAGHFFVLNGILLYVADEGEREEKKGKINARLRCIFENGTESDMLLRSLAAELYKKGNGRRVIFSVDESLEHIKSFTEDDQETGWIYILRSKSQNLEISSIEDLYKIGFSKQPVNDRIKNAEKEPTFLMAPVEVVAEYQCLNLNSQKLELLLHRFFAESCLNLDISNFENQRIEPREWFVVPIEIIDQAITLLISGEIIHYRYDAIKQEIVLRDK